MFETAETLSNHLLPRTSLRYQINYYRQIDNTPTILCSRGSRVRAYKGQSHKPIDIMNSDILRPSNLTKSNLSYMHFFPAVLLKMYTIKAKHGLLVYCDV